MFANVSALRGVAVGLMSGTSLDGVDGVLLRIDGAAFQVVARASQAMPPALAGELLALQHSGNDELHRAALASNALMEVYAHVVQQLLQDAAMDAQDIDTIGAHGQTVRHSPSPQDPLHGYTIQLANPALLAERTGIDVVADFRSRDVAAGGQGAPLVPFFHRLAFGSDGTSTAVLNLGGIANLSVLVAGADNDGIGFDCGPGNVLMDAWARRHLGQPMDRDGAWAATGRVHGDLLQRMGSDPYFHRPPPKSTGRDRFHEAWLAVHCQDFADVPAADVQATLAELTAASCADCVLRYAPGCQRLIVCGGGAYNRHVLGRIQQRLPEVQVGISDDYGLHATMVEACAFAWMALLAQHRIALPLPRVTGASGPRILGAWYPGR
ncbi:anhydro-N-acetylmuramic acid kinase [Candidatus Symbiobacter mobilis]|uniref:Anhydro-N-acetylmuramic acid kinase n=1 Tax=Candidatus Symbiobacter mobilis CR TaxID=946483 RepID=U5N6G9_9BURK|nr:anhydro-N-acetylmuramic acid kinase [Candidatus Symbiobacter mobilis]AGX86967.1 anhydro-N-acetylmuramic acid kinase [Candidatus Symbiobacter mobilis CR]